MKYIKVELYKINVYLVYLCVVLYRSKFEGCLIIDKFSIDFDIVLLLYLFVIICENFF